MAEPRFRWPYWVWCALALSLLATEQGRAIAIWIHALRFGLVALAAFLVVLRLFSRLFDRYGWVHFVAAFWILNQAIVYGDLLGEMPTIVRMLNGALTLVGLAVLVHYALLVRQHNARRLELCDLVDKSLADAVEAAGMIARTGHPSGEPLIESLGAVASYSSHLKAHLAGYGT